jgi:hypothetical protein
MQRRAHVLQLHASCLPLDANSLGLSMCGSALHPSHTWASREQKASIRRHLTSVLHLLRSKQLRTTQMLYRATTIMLDPNNGRVSSAVTPVLSQLCHHGLQPPLPLSPGPTASKPGPPAASGGSPKDCTTCRPCNPPAPQTIAYINAKSHLPSMPLVKKFNGRGFLTLFQGHSSMLKLSGRSIMSKLTFEPPPTPAATRGR